ncbi:MAG: response regulator [Flavobacteriales bacterium]|nr:response regulator [Flavobacteriales bacterium]
MKNKDLIYIVEDSDIIRDVVSLVFSSKQNTIVKSYKTGEELCSDIKDETPHLLILDYYLNAHDKNAMNGYDVLKKLVEKNKKINTILLSGMHDETKIEQLKSLGVVDFIDKNVDNLFEELESAYSKYFQPSIGAS